MDCHWCRHLLGDTLFPSKSPVLPRAILGLTLHQLLLLVGDPINTPWTSQGRYRYDPTKVGEAQVASSIALDILVLFFPMPIIAKLHMSLKKKIVISFIFWLGAVYVLLPKTQWPPTDTDYA
jgi:hypothetical protein